MLLLASSVLALLAGPLLYHWLSRRQSWLALLDNFIFVVIGGLLLFHVMPEALQLGGWPVLVLLLLGALGPGQLEHLFSKAARTTHNLTLLVGVSGLALHAMTDGAALVDVDRSHSDALLALGVVLHRLPVGLTIWWLLRPHFGRAVAGSVLALLMAGTLVGYGIGFQWLPQLGDAQLGWLQGLVAGTLLHVVLHRPFHKGKEARAWMAGLGGVLGAAVLLLISVPAWLGFHLHHDHELVEPALATGAALERLWMLLLALSPWLLLSYALALLLNRWRPFRHQQAVTDGSKGAFTGMAWGLALPVCLPDAARVYPRLLQHGARPPMALAFLLAAPVFGIDALLASLALLGPELTLWRFGAVLALALLSVAILMRLVPQLPPRSCYKHDAQAPLRSAFEMGYGHLVDHTAPWVITGLVLAATLAPHPIWEALAVHPIGQTLLVLVLALPLHLCATGLTPVVAILLAFGLDLGAALALLLVGPALNLGLLRYLAEQHSRRFAFAYGLVVMALAALLALFVGQGLGLAVTPPALDMAELSSPWRIASALALVGIFVWVMLRRGARGFVAELWPKGLNISPHHHH
ncbi:permease [Gallaecimonas sp. GXIMD4217]|uniref:permease n=1 Tax=Gallaecimonas sp. GXIMD4217 TaxID=3131927 RepID=UPI00311AF794